MTHPRRRFPQPAHVLTEPLEPRRLLAAAVVVPVAPLNVPELRNRVAPPRTTASTGTTVYFVTQDPATLRETIRRSDGTPDGSAIVTDDYNSGGATGNLTPVGSKLLFTGQGSNSYSYTVYSVETGTANSSAAALGTATTPIIPVGNVAYFANNINSGALYRTDGTPFGTQTVRTGYTYNLTAAGDGLYFTNQGLWRVGPTGSPVRVWTGATSDTTTGLNVAVARGRVFFCATPSNSSTPWLFVSDGTAATTTPLAPLDFDFISRSPNLTAVGDVVYFSALHGSNTPALWRSDGTPAGTVPVRDLNTRTQWPSKLTAVGNRLYFAASDGTHGTEPWVSDGTPDGTFMLADVATGSDSCSPAAFTATAAGTVLFSAGDRPHGIELWTTDGTPINTRLLTDAWPGPAGTAPRDLVAGPGGAVFYLANDPAAGQVLMRSDATPANTTIAFDPRPGSYNPVWLDPTVSANGTRLFFPAGAGSFADHELWSSDGAPAGTALVKNLSGPTSPFPTALSNFIDFNGSLYFVADTPQQGAELWKSDGTAAGTTIVADLAWGANSSDPNSFVIRNGLLYFHARAYARDGTMQEGTWRTDGSTAGTVFVSGPGQPVADPKKVLLDGVTYAASANSLLRYDSAGNPTTVVTLQPSYNASTSGRTIRDLTAAGNRLYFRFDGGNSGDEPWVSDGTPNGTHLLKDINPDSYGLTGSRPYGFVHLGGHVLFAATPSQFGPSRIYATDGTTGSTRPLTESVELLTSAAFWKVLGNQILFLGRDAAGGSELWRTDGTAAGTFPLMDINPGPAHSSPSLPTFHDGLLYFTADDGTAGRELWVTDGTPNGTRRLTDINPGPAHSSPSAFTAMGDTLYFSATDGTQPWLFALRTAAPAGLTPSPDARLFLTGPATAPVLTIDGGSAVISSDLQATWPNLGLDVRNGASLTLAAGQRFTSLSLTGGSSVTLAASSFSINDLRIDPTSTLDLADSTLTLVNPSAPDSHPTHPSLREYLLTAQLFSSSASPTQRLGYLDSPSSTLVKLTLTGDANLDGLLTPDDQALLDRGRARNSSTWSAGDFNYDGQVTDADASLFHHALTPTAPAALTLTPIVVAQPAAAPAPTKPLFQNPKAKPKQKPKPASKPAKLATPAKLVKPANPVKRPTPLLRPLRFLLSHHSIR
jgi:ELWxxDGT repeat protein